MVITTKKDMSWRRRFFGNNNNNQDKRGWSFGRQPQQQQQQQQVPNNMQRTPLLLSPLNGFQPGLFFPQNMGLMAHQQTGFNPRNIMPGNQFQQLPRNQSSPVPRNIAFTNSSPPAKNNVNANRKRTHVGSSSSQDDLHGKRAKGADTKNTAANTGPREYSQLTEQAEALVRFNSQSEELIEKKFRLRSALLAMIKKQFPTVSLHLVGSSCNGFASDTSDADFCVMISQSRKINQRYEARTYLSAIQKLIRPIRSLKGIQLIRAKVPILKFTDAISGCECDVNINNPVGIRNTHLLRTYSLIDDRVRPMVLAVKKWGKERKINDASQGTLSSYSLVLMILHYLQCGCNPPVLKSLQREYPQYFQVDSDVDELPLFEPADIIPCNSSKNKESVGQLLEGFFHYFAGVFSWDTMIMSVREGRTLAKRNLSEFQDKYICIEEPFERTCTSRAVHEQSKFQLIKKEFQRADDKLKEQLSLEHIT